MADVTIKGFDDLLAKLGALQRKDANAILRKALREGARPIKDMVESNTPVESRRFPSHDPGTLKRSWKIRAGKSADKGPRILVLSTFRRYYGRFVDYGHLIGKRSGYVKYIQSWKMPERRNILKSGKWRKESREAHQMRVTEFKARREAALAKHETRTGRVAGARFVEKSLEQAKGIALNLIRGYIARGLKEYFANKAFGRGLGLDE